MRVGYSFPVRAVGNSDILEQNRREYRGRILIRPTSPGL